MDSIIQKRQSLHRQVQGHQEQIQYLQEEIRKAQKLASLGTMSCLVAHEFNNLLTPIISYAELALKHPEDTHLMRKALEKSVKQGYKATQIIQSILGYARNNQTHAEKTNIALLVHDCFQCLARDFQKDNITVELSIPEDLEVEVFSGQIQQVLINLLINARHAMLERGGRLALTACLQDENLFTLVVADTGCGIPQETLGRIFEPFFTTKTESGPNDIQGTGLGLSVCKEIIESHGGHIEVVSEIGRGTTFSITLPVRQEACEAAMAEVSI